MENQPMVSAPILRRQIAFEQDYEMNSPLERECRPYENTHHWPTDMEPTSDQIKAGSTMNLDLSDKEPTKSFAQKDYKDPEPMIGRISNQPILVGEPDNFSGKGEDTTRWLMAMKAYFKMHQDYYDNERRITTVFLNKLTTGRAGTFAEGWYVKLTNPSISDSETMVDKLFTTFKETFIPRDIQDQAHQDLYSLSMKQLNGDFDKYSVAFKLAQAHSEIYDDHLLIDALQRGVSYDLAVMMTGAAKPRGQEETGWRWEQWLEKAGEFYRNNI